MNPIVESMYDQLPIIRKHEKLIPNINAINITIVEIKLYFLNFEFSENCMAAGSKSTKG